MTDHTHVIKVPCIVCGQQFEYRITLPTSVICTHCGSLVDARLGIAKLGAKEEVHD